MKIEKLAKDLLLINGKIIDPHNRKTFDGDVWLKNGKIAGLGDVNTPKGAEKIDCSGKVITHGLSLIHI